jgi:ribosome biogenesis GTPase
LGLEKNEALIEGQVIQTSPFKIQTADAAIPCKSALEAAIGDRVLYSPTIQKIVKLLPRKTLLSRPDPHNPRLQLVLAANMDVVVNVVSVRTPPLRLGLIDRYLIAIQQSGAEPLLCVNKVDLGMPDAVLQPYQDIGVPIVYCSAATGEGLDELRQRIAGKLCVFTGHSGVGKSSLLNALAPELSAATAGVSEGNRKGRHTTTSSKIYDLPNGARIIDTPGIRELGLWNVSSDEIRHYFPEFDDFSRQCAFSDCSHTHEPRCAVKQALEEGRIPRPRYDAYLRIKASPGVGEVGQ